MSLNILNSNKKPSRKAKILPQFSISSENKPLLDLLEIQRKSFFDFLQHGIPHELAKIAVFRETAKNSTCKQELELKFNPETYKFISPNFTPKEAILNGKTYACKVYVQATLMIRSPSDIQKTNLFSVVTNPHISFPDKSSSLNPEGVSFATCKGLQKEKVKHKSNFHLSFNDKNKRLNASKLLHNTYTKWLQSPFVYYSNSLTFSPPTCNAYPVQAGGYWGVKLLTSNLCKGSETEKQKRGFYSSPSTTDFSALQPLQGTPIKTGTWQLLQIFEPAHIPCKPEGTGGYSYSKSKARSSSAFAKVNFSASAAVNLRYPYTNGNLTPYPEGVNTHTKSKICMVLRSRSVRSWDFAELHIRFGKAHLRQCWLPLSKTLLSKKLHVGLFAKSGVWELLKNKKSNIFEKQLVALDETAKLKSLYVRKQKQLHLLSDAYPCEAQGLPSNAALVPEEVQLPFVNSSPRILAQLWSPASALQPSMRVKGTATVSLTPGTRKGTGSAAYSLTQFRRNSIQIEDLSGVTEGLQIEDLYPEGHALQLRKKKDYSSIPTSCSTQEAAQNIQIFRPWIFLGELPLMTKRGHFILNGSPRVIVNQIARCPGIYFQEKRRGVGIEQEIRVSADLIPQRGPWLRIQSDWEGRFWARLKQEGRVKYATLYEAFQEFEKEYNPPLICLLSNSYFTNTTSSLFSKSENITFQERKIKEDRQKKALIRLFKNSSRYSLGKLGRSRVNERIHSSFTRPSHSATQTQGRLRNWQSKEEIAQLRGLRSVGSNKSQIQRLPLRNSEGISFPNNGVNKLITSNYDNSSNYTNNFLTNRKNILQILGPETGSEAYTLYTPFNAYPSGLPCEAQGYKSTICNPKGQLIKAYIEAPLSLNSAGKELRYFFNEGYSLQSYDLLLQQHKADALLLEKELSRRQSNRVKEPISFSEKYLFKEEQLLQQHEDSVQSKEEELAKRQRNSEGIVLTNKRSLPRASRKVLGSSEEIMLTNCVNELMAKDLDAIHTCLERLLEGQGFTDDIDNLKNRFIRTSGKLLQQQFELGLFRLNEVIMPLLGNLLPDYPRLTKSKYSTNKNSKGNNSALQDTNLVDKFKPAYGVKSTRILSTSKNEGYSVDSKREWNLRAVTRINLLRDDFRAVARGYPPAIARVNPFTFPRVSPLFNYASSVGSQLRKTNPSYYKSSNQRIPVQSSGSPVRSSGSSQEVWDTATVCNSWYSKKEQQYVQSKERLLPLLRCTSLPQRGLRRRHKLFTSSLLRVLAERRRNKYENVIYLRETEMKKPVANGYSKEISLIKNAPFRWLRTSKPINSAFREFFGSNPLSQYMDQTNPLAEITHKRRLSSMGPGGIKRETAGMEVRGIHPTHYGRVCPIETPEGKNAGLVNSPTVYGRVGNHGFLETPLYQVIENQVQTKRWTFFSAQYEEKQNSSLATCDTGLLQFNFLAHVPIPVQTANNPLTHFQQVERHRVGYRALSPIQTISIATALIPFLEHDDANRALMGSNMQRQAIPLLSPERPIVGTGFEPLVVMESGQALQATKLGCVSQADANSIIIHTRYSIEKPLSQNILQNSDLPWSRALMHRFGIRIPHSAESTFRSNMRVGERSVWDKNGVITPHSYKCSRTVLGYAGPLKIENLYEMRVGFSSLNPLQVTSPHISYTRASRRVLGVTHTQAKSSYKSLTHTYPSNGTLLTKGVNYLNSLQVANPHISFPDKSSSLNPLQIEDLSGKEINKKHISYSHNTFLFRPLKQHLQFYERSNQETCLNQRPLVQEGDWIQKGDFLADSSASRSGDLALGKNVTVAYMPWEGYNFEDAIVISDRLVSDDIYTSLHIERYEIKVSKNSQGKERITNRVPGSSHSLKHLDNFGIARVSSWVQPGDILVGKVVELKRPLSPYERLAWELASRLSPKSPEREKWLNKVWLEDISLRLPPGVCGRVINSQIISTEYASMSDPSLLGISQGSQQRSVGEQTIYPQEVHVYLAVKRKIQIGDKLAGRHGNKGIVSAILPQEDMPYLGDGSCIDMVLNPLGVPSRMNLGQIFECLLGLAGSQLGCNFRITPFDEIAGGEASRSLVFLKLYQCRLMYKQQWLFTPTFPGKSKLFDGRTGEPFENWVTVGQAYMLKLIHMVDHKIHARSTGPYSLFTRQPVRGRSRRGGQRLGEMEVWAVEGFGAAYTLQEFLTIKSDDLKARTALQKGFYKQNDVTFGKIHIAPGNPEAFKVLVSELQALCLHIQM